MPVKLQGGELIAGRIVAIYLVAEDYGKNDMDDPIKTHKERKVIGRLKRIRQSEHWQSRAAGLKPELQFSIRDFDYKEEKLLKYNNVLYDIVRVDDSRGINIELICSKEVNKSNPQRDGD